MADKKPNGVIKKPFQKWHHKDLVRIFDLNPVENAEVLIEWINAKHLIPKLDEVSVESLRVELKKMESDWNENELLMQFIAPFLFLVKYSGDGFRSYSDRALSGHIGEHELYGRVDWMAAAGEYEPTNPYFFIHEYKKSHGTEADPYGQLLSAMLVAADKNGDGLPFYGAYVEGKFWYFVVLYGTTVSRSDAYDATKPEQLGQIWSALVEVKHRILARIHGK